MRRGQPRAIDAGRTGWALAHGAVLVALVLLAAPSRAGADDAGGTAAPYLAAQAAGKLGSIEARAVADPAKASLPPVPVEGVTVAVLPWSEGVEARLEAIKAGTRDSMGRFMASASGVRSVLTAWARDLSAAGAPDLVRHGKTDGSGAARFADVPAGDWLLVAWREETTKTERSVKLPKRDGGGFTPTPESTGHTLVRYWRSRLSVAEGLTADARLTDRGVWLSAVDPVLKTPVDPPIGTTGPQRHR